MEYKVTESVSFSEQTYGKWGNHLAKFKVEGQDKLLSAFTKYPVKVGDTLHGDIKPVEKEGKTYWNFEFAKKDDKGPAANNAATAEIKNILSLKVIPQLEAIWGRLGLVLEQQGIAVDKEKNLDPGQIDQSFENSPF